MKIALLGYGKMGQAIEKIALERGHEIVIRKDVEPIEVDLNIADVAIDFSHPTAAYDNIKSSIDNGVPVVSGTTGWLDKYKEIVTHCENNEGSFIYASNFSIGVNLFFNLNSQLAELMKRSSSQGDSMLHLFFPECTSISSARVIAVPLGASNL